MEKKEVIELFINVFKKEFPNKETYYNGLSDNDKKEMIVDLFYDCAEIIDEENPYLRDMEKDENDRWYDKYFDEVCQLFEKYLSE